MPGFLIFLGLLIGAGVHGYFLYNSAVLTNADSFAYLQMSHHLNNFSLEGLGSGWFGFLYSLCISLFDTILTDSFLSGKIANIGLFLLGGIFLHFLGQRYLHQVYSWFLTILYGTSTALLYYGTNILSENLYIPLFILFFTFIIRYMEEENPLEMLYVGILIGLMYLTRSEAFIYGAPVGVLIIFFCVARKLGWARYFLSNAFLALGFLIIALPYIYYLHTLTGEWGITNKGASNIRQAMMRGVETMDDAGFEQAVAELTDDKTAFKSGFVGGLPYKKADGEYSLRMLIEKDSAAFIERWKQNVGKLGSETLPKMLLGESLKYRQDSTFKFSGNPLFIGLLFVPLFFTVYGIILLYFDRRRFPLYTFGLLFMTASIFFTMFFVLERYFIPFLPILLIFTAYGVQGFLRSIERIQIIRILLFGGIIIGVNILGIKYMIDHGREVEERYLIKKEVGQRLQENQARLFPGKESLRIMERFPIVTYYAGSWERWITPYANQTDIIAYAKHNKIDILVVDTLDFKSYRPELIYLLNPDSSNTLKSKALEPIIFGKKRREQTPYYQKYGHKVILYKFVY